MRNLTHSNTLFIAVLLLVFIPLTSFTQKTVKSKPIIFSGTIKNIPVSDNGKQIISVSFPKRADNNPVQITVDKNGFFHDTIWGPEGKYFVEHGNFPYPLYFVPGNKYNIQYTFNTNTPLLPNLVTLAGNDTLINRYFITQQQQKTFFNPTEVMAEDAYVKYLNDWKTNQLNRITTYKLSKKIATKEKKEITYEYLFNLLLFSRYHEQRDSSFKPSSLVTQQFNINYNNEKDYHLYSYYRRFVYEYYMLRLDEIEKEKLKKDTTFDLRQNRQRLINELVANKFIKNNILSQMVLYDLKTVKDIELYYQDFKTLYTGNDEKIKEQALDVYLRLTQLKKGTPSPQFENFINYKGGTNSLSDFKGKFVFIDMWATWCGNCWGEFPYIKKMEAKYANKNIVFVSISLDDDKEKWAQIIEKEKLPGIQLLSKGQDDPFFIEYAVYGIPRYILIDPDGNIINYSTARPSEEEEIARLFKSVGL